MKDAEYVLPLDSREFEIDLGREMRRTVVDLIRGDEPTTILGVLLASEGELTITDIASRLQRPIGLVACNVEKLEDEDLCVRIAAGDARMVRLFAPFTNHND
jgi:hypothetical protein